MGEVGISLFPMPCSFERLFKTGTLSPGILTYSLARRVGRLAAGVDFADFTGGVAVRVEFDQAGYVVRH